MVVAMYIRCVKEIRRIIRIRLCLRDAYSELFKILECGVIEIVGIGTRYIVTNCVIS